MYTKFFIIEMQLKLCKVINLWTVYNVTHYGDCFDMASSESRRSQCFTMNQEQNIE